MTADHLKVELDSMLKTDVSENDADAIASVSSLDIHPRQQKTSIEEHAVTTLDSLTAVLCSHPKVTRRQHQQLIGKWKKTKTLK